MKPVGLWVLLVCLLISDPAARAGTVRTQPVKYWSRAVFGTGCRQKVHDQDAAQVMVRLKVGKADLLARVTKKSATVLELALGKAVFAQVKSVALRG